MAKMPDLAAIRDWCLSKFQPLGNYAAAKDIPTVTSVLTNDSGYITKDVSDLKNYYSKTDIEAKGYLTDIAVASDTVPGKVKVDGTSITIDSDGTIHAVTAKEFENNMLGGAS